MQYFLKQLKARHLTYSRSKLPIIIPKYLAQAYPLSKPLCLHCTQLLSSLKILSWLVQDFVYPDNVSYPIGGSDAHRFVVMQIHYDNPMMRSGEQCLNLKLNQRELWLHIWPSNYDSDVQDSSGITFVYENAPRENDAGILLVGHEVNRLMIVPPMVPNYGITSVCSDQCTSRVSCSQSCVYQNLKFVFIKISSFDELQFIA